MTEIGGNIVKAVVSAARKITGREPAPEASAKKTPARKTAAQKMTAKKAPAKKVAPHKTTAKKATAKKATAKKATTKKSARARSPAAPQPSTAEVRAWARTVGLPVPYSRPPPPPKSGRPGTTPTARTDRKASPKYYARDEIGKHTGHTKRGEHKTGDASLAGRVVKQT